MDLCYECYCNVHGFIPREFVTTIEGPEVVCEVCFIDEVVIEVEGSIIE